jgi:membrane associated rhomboid family serine protease
MAQYGRSRGGGRGPSRWRQIFGQARITQGALYILFATAGLSFIYLLGGVELRERMAALMVATGLSLWGELKLWQLATSPLVETDFIALLFEGFMLWMFLPALERWWGMKRFLVFAAVTSLVSVAVGTLAGVLLGGPSYVVPVAGLDPFVFAGIVAYGVLFANQPVQFFGVLPMTGRQMAWGMIAFVALFVLLGQAWVDGAARAAAMIAAWAMTSQRSSPRLWWLKYKQARLRRRASHLKVVGGGKGGGKGSGKKDEKRWMN